MKKAVVFTLGCKVNECESDSIITGLKEIGYQVFDSLEVADLYVVNTCAVTNEAEKKSRQTYSRIRKLSKTAKIIFIGCASQKNPQAFLKKDENLLVAGSFNKQKILSMLSEKGVVEQPPCTDFEELLPVSSLRTRAYIKVQDGCNNFCSYCIIPYLRGRNRSRNPQNILQEINGLTAEEVIINGINLSAYNYNGLDLADLVERLNSVDKRIRLGSLEVNIITEKLLRNLKNLKKFAPHFHLSLQSGSNATLKAMNRKYTREEFIEKVDLIREYFPTAGITTDIIVGFPTETEKDFLDTLSLVERVKFSDIHAFAFSKREGTVAYKMPDINGEIKKARLDILLEKKKECKLNFATQNVGKELTFLPEEVKGEYTEGYSENYLRLYVKENLPHSPVKVKVVNPYKEGAIAVVI